MTRSRKHGQSNVVYMVFVLLTVPFCCQAWMANPKSSLMSRGDSCATSGLLNMFAERQSFEIRCAKDPHGSDHEKVAKSSSMDRRSMLMLSSMLMMMWNGPDVAHGFPLLPSEERIQLELCLVSILRVRYWAEEEGRKIKEMLDLERTSGLSDRQKGPYLEARLGAKAAITGKIGGGASEKVFLLAKLKIKDCIQDATRTYKDTNKDNFTKGELRKQMALLDGYGSDILESLANVVEFDGLETTQDPSPRSTLALTMYNSNKALFIKRMLLERTVPSCDAFVNFFGRDKRDYCETYIRLTYPSEIPLQKAPDTLQPEQEQPQSP